MCIKYVYFNTYSDDLEDITERVESCTPGYICPNPRELHFDRDYAVPRDQAKASQARGDRLPGGPTNVSTPSPCSLSPSSASPNSRTGSSDASASSAADREPRDSRERRRHRRRTSDVYVNGTKVSSTSTTTTASSSSKPPSSPRTMPIPIQRASTMTYGGMEPPPERGRRPIIVEERVPSLYQSTPRMMPDIYNHTTIPSSRMSPRPAGGFRDLRDFRDVRDIRNDIRSDIRPDLRSDLRNDLREFRPVGIERTSTLRRPAPLPTMRPTTPTLDNNFLSPNRARVDRSPQGYGSAEDDQERQERRRRRRAARERASVMPSSLPAMGATDVFGSSPSSTSGVGSSAANSASASPAVSAVNKKLRWDDEQRRLHNERIASRPKLPRDQSVPTKTKVQGEVKSILKSASTSTSPAPPAEGRSRASSRASSTRPPSASRASSRPPSSSSRRASFMGPVGDMDDIFTGMSGLNISGSSSGAPTAPGAGPLDELPLDDAERSRLRNRFSMPPRRYTAGGAFKRRTEIWYPEEGRYRFM